MTAKERRMQVALGTVPERTKVLIFSDSKRYEYLMTGGTWYALDQDHGDGHRHSLNRINRAYVEGG